MHKRMRRSDLFKLLGIPDKMSVTFHNVWKAVPLVNFDGESIGTYDVKIVPTVPRTRNHRVLIVCKCGRDVPFGRLDQHKCPSTPVGSSSG